MTLQWNCVLCGERQFQFDIGPSPFHRCPVPPSISLKSVYDIHNALRMAQDDEGRPAFDEAAIEQIMRFLVTKLRVAR